MPWPRRTGATLIPPFDHPDVIAGQGTVGLEIAEQCAELGGNAGCRAGLLLRRWAVGRHRHRAGRPHAGGCRSTRWNRRPMTTPGGRWPRGAGCGSTRQREGSICDALLLAEPGRLTFAINRSLLAPGLTVTDDQALDAMAVAFGELRLVVEPGGAVALAAALSGALPIEGRTIRRRGDRRQCRPGGLRPGAGAGPVGWFSSPRARQCRGSAHRRGHDSRFLGRPDGARRSGR